MYKIFSMPMSRLGGLLPRELKSCTHFALACIVSYDRANEIIVKRLSSDIRRNITRKYKL